MRSLVLLAAVTLLPAALPAQAPAALPPAHEIVARYVAAIGGEAAVTAPRSVRTSGTFEMAGGAVRGDFVTVQTPSATALTITVPGLGELVTAFDGAHGWSVNPMQGPRLLDGLELAALREDAGSTGMLRRSPHLVSMETVARAEMDGEACWRVRFVYASGRETADCYAVESGLLLGSWATQESAMGRVAIETRVGEWRTFGALRTATVLRQRAMGQEQVLRVTAMEFDRADDAAAFAPPPAVHALLDGRAAGR